MSHSECVVCPICHRKFREINKAHLNGHGLTVKEFDTLYPECNRVSEMSLMKKDTLSRASEEVRKKLKYSHTLKAYKERYGDKEGELKYNEMRKNKSTWKSIESYKVRYGEDKGIEIREKHNKSKGVTLEKYVRKYGIKEGKIRHKEWLEKNRKTNSLKHYIDKHGNKKGREVWFKKNSGISASNSSVPKENWSAYQKYCALVDKHTRLSLQLNSLEKLELRGKEHHLDHKISKCYGFNNGIPAHIIGSIHNLEMLTASKNSIKRKQCSMTLEELMQMIQNEQPQKA